MGEETAGPVASYHDREAWLEERTKSIGGSEVAAIFGQHPFKTEQELWEEKTGRSDGPDQSLIMLKGQVLEDVAAERYEARTGRKTRRVGLRRRDGHPYLHASADRQVIAGTGEGDWHTEETLVGELKVPGYQVFSEVRRKGLRPYMILQGQLEAWTFGYPATSFGLLHADSFRDLAFDVPADLELQERIVNEAGEWWEKYVITDTRPPEREPEELKLPDVEGEVVQVSGADWEDAAREYAEAEMIYKEAQAIRDEAKEQVREMMPGYGAAEGAGIRAYLQRREGRTSWKDTAKALAEHAGLELEEFLVEGSPYDWFRIYVLKGAP
ncbi:MAG: lambda-exonuclease family protein [Longimicrobiales bacterium]